jgi:Spy/CpxP family protein refolding chaperone
MKAIRVMALGVLLLAVGAVSARAQGGAAQQGQAGGRRPDRLLDNMLLTDSQKAKIDNIQRKYLPDLQALRQSMSSGGDRTEGMQKWKAIVEKMQPEIRAVLTPDQQAIFDKNAAEQKARMEQMMKQG